MTTAGGKRLLPSDAVLALLGLLLAAPSLAYPFGRDQGVFFYVGRGWLHGELPYRDAFDQKTPLVYAVHALGVALFGEQQHAIRVIELFWVGLLGWCTGALCDGPERRTPGLRGFGVLAACTSYWGYFNFWDTAQTEIWASGFVVLAVWAVLRQPSPTWRMLLSGVAAGLALLAKPTSALLLVPVIVLQGVRASRARSEPGRARGVALELLGTFAALLATLALVAGYFAAAGALPAAVDAVARANLHNVEHEARFGSTLDVAVHALAVMAAAHPLSTALVVIPAGAGALAWRRRDFERLWRHAFCLALLLAAFASVCAQRKFYWYHWGVVVPVSAATLCLGARDVCDSVAAWPDGVARARRVPLAAAALLLLAFLFSWPGLRYAHVAWTTARYALGTLPRAGFLDEFRLPGFYDYARDERVGVWIREHSSPDDRIAVRGFEPAIYAVARRRAPTRWFWTEWLTDARRVYKRDEWLAEDLAALQARPPRYVVAFDSPTGGPNSPQYFTPLGYVQRLRESELSVMERAPK